MRTQSLYDMICPKCGKRGQLKLDRKKYYFICHYKYKGGFRHGTYVSACYIGKDFKA